MRRRRPPRRRNFQRRTARVGRISGAPCADARHNGSRWRTGLGTPPACRTISATGSPAQRTYSRPTCSTATAGCWSRMSTCCATRCGMLGRAPSHRPCPGGAAGSHALHLDAAAGRRRFFRPLARTEKVVYQGAVAARAPLAGQASARRARHLAAAVLGPCHPRRAGRRQATWTTCISIRAAARVGAWCRADAPVMRDGCPGFAPALRPGAAVGR